MLLVALTRYCYRAGPSCRRTPCAANARLRHESVHMSQTARASGLGLGEPVHARGKATDLCARTPVTTKLKKAYTVQRNALKQECNERAGRRASEGVHHKATVSHGPGRAG